jgi:hypothetical protein
MGNRFLFPTFFLFFFRFGKRRWGRWKKQISHSPGKRNTHRLPTRCIVYIYSRELKKEKKKGEMGDFIE